MYTCRYCKAEHQEPVKFCTKCGMKMKKRQDTQESSSEKKDNSQESNTENLQKDEPIDSSNSPEEGVSKNNIEEKKDDKDASEEDPFVYKFDSGSSDGEKKSGDGIWLAIVAIVVVIAIIIIGTSRKNAQENESKENTDKAIETSIIDDSENTSDEVSKNTNIEEEVGEITKTTEEESNPSETASSSLVDVSALKFDYSPKQVKDKDFSTAWIEAERDAGIGEFIKIDYGADKEISRIGIVPGYGRDEGIYNENNRVKKLTLEFSDGSTVEKELEDKYTMHMLDFEKRTTSSVKVIINEVYSGSKYNDTAISEIDIDSDYVKNNDPDGALRFYEENKKESAKRPS